MEVLGVEAELQLFKQSPFGACRSLSGAFDHRRGERRLGGTMDDHDAVARAGIDAVVAELVATRNILGAGEHQTASQRALFIMNERRGLGDALVALLESLHSMPYEDRTPAVHVAVVRAKKVLGIEG